MDFKMEKEFLLSIVKYCDRNILDLYFDTWSDSKIVSGSRDSPLCLRTKISLVGNCSLPEQFRDSGLVGKMM